MCDVSGEDVVRVGEVVVGEDLALLPSSDYILFLSARTHKLYPHTPPPLAPHGPPTQKNTEKNTRATQATHDTHIRGGEGNERGHDERGGGVTVGARQHGDDGAARIYHGTSALWYSMRGLATVNDTRGGEGGVSRSEARAEVEDMDAAALEAEADQVHLSAGQRQLKAAMRHLKAAYTSSLRPLKPHPRWI